MNIKSILSKIDEVIPFVLSETWDNTGLVLGDTDMLVSKICLTLDATPEVINQAAELKCDLLITHHPLIYSPIRIIDTSTITGATIHKAIKNDIAIISLHTNWDKLGLNYALASALNLRNIRTLQPNRKEEDRIGVIGELSQEQHIDSFLRTLKDSWNLSHVICHEAKDKTTVSSVALCGGAGGEFWLDAFHEKADVFITAEVKRHNYLASLYKGLSIVEIDHYEMENYSLTNLKKLLEKTIDISMEIIYSSSNINIITR